MADLSASMNALFTRDDHFHGRGINLAIISILFTLVASALVVCRVISRASVGRNQGLDDYLIVVSMVFSVALTIANCISVGDGVGKSIKSLDKHDLHKALQAFWVAQIVYKVSINATKVSICLLYLRIFPQRRFRQAVYVIMGYVALYAFASIVATIVQCLPVERVWNRGVPGHCINLTAFWYANATANILGDILILGLPMPVIKGLNLPRAQRWGLFLVFALGGFVCITSILRMTTLKAGSKNTDTTYGTLNSTIWTTIEANTAIICACLPMMKAPLTMMFPKLFPRGPSATPEYSAGSAQRRRQSSAPPSRGSVTWRPIKSKQPSLKERASSMFGSGKGSEEGIKTPAPADHTNAIPLNKITKTTQVDVQVGTDDRNENGSPLSRRNSQRMRSISQAHLVGPEPAF